MSRFKDVPKSPGVYAIRHCSGAEYIGSSNNLWRRVGYNQWQLRNGKHSSPDLQEMWSCTPESSWSCVVLELCDECSLVAREQHYMDRSAHLLNLMKIAGKKAPGRVWTEESKRKARESRARYLEDPAARAALSERARVQHAEGRLGQDTWSEESRQAAFTKVRAHNSDPALREKRAEKARQQHAEGKLGPATWK